MLRFFVETIIYVKRVIVKLIRIFHSDDNNVDRS